MAIAAAGRRSSRSRPAPLRWLALLARNFVFVISGVPVQLAGLAVLALPWLIPYALARPDATAVFPDGFWPVVAALAMSAALALLVWAPLTFIHRHRCWSVLGRDIPPPPRADGTSLPRRLGNALRSEATWRQLGYHVVIGPVMAAGGLLTLGLLFGGAQLAGSNGYSSLFPKASAALSASPKGRVIATAIGIILLLAAPVVAGLVTWLDGMAATALLGPSRSVELERRVETLAHSRAGVVDAADAERRRIERDLHDGAQQRLVSLAMNLGIARETLTDLPAEARQVIAAAHDEAKEALGELRSLVRGLHPAVLNDRGLDAALSGIAARAPLPVRLTVDMGERASPTVEAVAYFVVSECLANIARHSNAKQATIEVRRAGGLLRIQVTDDGVGGADPARGTGLASLEQRARSVDGSLQLVSPAGGPTVITAELPCES
jgi:signal transduction histidine kinase